MKINFLFPGKTKEPFLAEGISSYLKRLKPMVEAYEVILKAASAPPGAGSPAESLARAREAAAILDRCRAGDFLIVLDLQGDRLSSPELAEKIALLQSVGTRVMNVVVGGPWGVDESLIRRANLRLSFGPMTFPHELARMMILEQIYRAYTILNNIPYHK